MSDEPKRDEMPAGGYDDDRLLACALGLDDDPALLAAAEDDPELAARLAAMRADVASIGAQVRAAVPSPDETYTDLAGARWSSLGEFIEPPAQKKKSRRGRWWVLAPVGALVLFALLIGIVAMNRGGAASTSGSSAEVTRSSGGSSDQSGQSAGTAAPAAVGPESIGDQFVDEFDRFAVVVLARARQATGALQRFAVVRIFKGDAPNVVSLVVNDRPADRGRLHLLMLDPVPGAETQDTSPVPAPSSPTSKAMNADYGRPLNVAYTYDGRPTMVREFAAGTDPDSVALPIP